MWGPNIHATSPLFRRVEGLSQASEAIADIFARLGRRIRGNKNVAAEAAEAAEATESGIEASTPKPFPRPGRLSFEEASEAPSSPQRLRRPFRFAGTEAGYTGDADQALIRARLYDRPSLQSQPAADATDTGLEGGKKVYSHFWQDPKQRPRMAVAAAVSAGSALLIGQKMHRDQEAIQNLNAQVAESQAQQEAQVQQAVAQNEARAAAAPSHSGLRRRGTPTIISERESEASPLLVKRFNPFAAARAVIANTPAAGGARDFQMILQRYPSESNQMIVKSLLGAGALTAVAGAFLWIGSTKDTKHDAPPPAPANLSEAHRTTPNTVLADSKIHTMIFKRLEVTRQDRPGSVANEHLAKRMFNPHAGGANNNLADGRATAQIVPLDMELPADAVEATRELSPWVLAIPVFAATVATFGGLVGFIVAYNKKHPQNQSVDNPSHPPVFKRAVGVTRLGEAGQDMETLAAKMQIGPLQEQEDAERFEDYAFVAIPIGRAAAFKLYSSFKEPIHQAISQERQQSKKKRLRHEQPTVADSHRFDQGQREEGGATLSKRSLKDLSKMAKVVGKDLKSLVRKTSLSASQRKARAKRFRTYALSGGAATTFEATNAYLLLELVTADHGVKKKGFQRLRRKRRPQRKQYTGPIESDVNRNNDEGSEASLSKRSLKDITEMAKLAEADFKTLINRTPLTPMEMQARAQRLRKYALLGGAAAAFEAAKAYLFYKVVDARARKDERQRLLEQERQQHETHVEPVHRPTVMKRDEVGEEHLSRRSLKDALVEMWRMAPEDFNVAQRRLPLSHAEFRARERRARNWFILVTGAFVSAESALAYLYYRLTSAKAREKEQQRLQAERQRDEQQTKAPDDPGLKKRDAILDRPLSKRWSKKILSDLWRNAGERLNIVPQRHALTWTERRIRAQKVRKWAMLTGAIAAAEAGFTYLFYKLINSETREKERQWQQREQLRAFKKGVSASPDHHMLDESSSKHLDKRALVNPVTEIEMAAAREEAVDPRWVRWKQDAAEFGKGFVAYCTAMMTVLAAGAGITWLVSRHTSKEDGPHANGAAFNGANDLHKRAHDAVVRNDSGRPVT
ncbi:hypothetical protein PSEUBRA_003402 [Kalmanozyma brasiliensis GHG001]|uniref:uncharacterized protein n=1 Tax=Kalmanozyma brasiliensis (strain GHG001) TaxID=1365824 RepID=UPI002868002A|nr:uncharacterized protein PSEUBRA_003402 [Kalmanozyma brasiliensis GHG001]KAF6767236.1 hypothetical protein PSEUBRA_003402 [Kalmanozyma brasiliensis GHG001]